MLNVLNRKPTGTIPHEPVKVCSSFRVGLARQTLPRTTHVLFSSELPLLSRRTVLASPCSRAARTRCSASHRPSHRLWRLGRRTAVRGSVVLLRHAADELRGGTDFDGLRITATKVATLVRLLRRAG